MSAAAGTPGLLSGYTSAGSVVRGAAANSRLGQWMGGVSDGVRGLGTAIGNTRAGGAVTGWLNRTTMPLRQRVAGVGAAAIIQGSVMRQGLSGMLGRPEGP